MATTTIIPGRIVKDNSTATTGAIAHSLTITNAAKLISVTLKVNTAPSTSENYTITLDALAGVTYDTLLYTKDLAGGAVTALAWFPDETKWLEPGDIITVAYTNTDARTFGSQITVEEVF